MLQSVRKEGEQGNLHDDREVVANAVADSGAAQHEVKLSVIIPCLNAERTIGEQLAALAAQRWSERWEVIVADNGSTDGTLEVVRRFAGRLPELRVVDASQRRGSGYARNRGAAVARGEWLAFCDADDVVAPGWVAAMGRRWRAMNLSPAVLVTIWSMTRSGRLRNVCPNRTVCSSTSIRVICLMRAAAA